MAIESFDDKAFNPQAFGKYIESLPKLRENALAKANIFMSNQTVRDMFANQSTTAYGIVPVIGYFAGTSQNYDGNTDLTGDKLSTYSYGVSSYGRAIVGQEKDFTQDLIPGLNPLDQIATKMADRWDDINEDTLVSLIKGIFASTATGGSAFATKHTLEVDAIDETSIYDATQQACGDKNKNFSFAIMHSKIANILAKKQLLSYIKYTDANGIQTNTNIAQWGDKTVLVDDTTTKDAVTGKYVTYILGTNSFIKELLNVAVPFERERKGLIAGGTTYLINRERRILHPYGFSYLKASQASLSPTDAEFEMGANWDLMKSADGETYIDDKLIPIARIVSTEGESQSI